MPDPPRSGTRIRYDGPPCPAVDDLRRVLEGFDAGEIALEAVPLGRRTGQAFHLERRGRRTRIRYTTANSRENAVYTLLDRWGFRWYGPSEHWFVAPAAVPDDDLPGRWIAPTFRNRSFFGTGGLDTPVPGDPEYRYKSRWLAWKRRNRFNADFPAVGHTGMAFHQENRHLLDRHPEWFASESGRRAGRFRIEVPEAVAAYAAWVRRRSSVGGAPFANVGVDPEDGRGMDDDPLPPDGFAGIRGWNHADKWWWVANAVAQGFPEDDSRTVVSMYAYGDGPTNVLVPRFPLRRNVYPVIIPYAFQTGYQPDEMVRVWSRATRGRMGIYDYWNITQWSLGQPQFALHTLRSRLAFWNAHGIDGLYIETTDAAGPMGHAWWLAGQLAFDLSQDQDALFDRYLTDCFGAAAPALRRMFERWSRLPQGPGEVALSLADLADADRRVVRGGPEWRRLVDLKAYVHFLRLLNAHDGTQASKDRLFAYLYAIHDRMLVQTSAFVGQHYIAPLDAGNATPKEPAPPATDSQIDATFAQDRRDAPPRYAVSLSTPDLRAARPTGPVSPTAWRFGRNPLVTLWAPGDGRLAFDAGVERGGSTELTVFTDRGIVLRERLGGSGAFAETFDGRTWDMRPFAVRVRPGERVWIRMRGAFNRLTVRSDVVLFNAHHGDDFDNYAYPVHYLSIPPDCDRLVIEDGTGPTAPKGVFFLPELDGSRGETRPALPLDVRNLYAVDLPPAWRGRVIGCAFSHTGWTVRNVPGLVALQPFTVPR